MDEAFLWGHLSSNESYGRPDANVDYVQISFEDSHASDDYKEYKHAAHGAYVAKTNNLLFNLYPMRAFVLMTTRFDGYLGFPGGLIDDSDKSIVEGLNRELREEIHVDDTKHGFKQEHHLISYVNQIKKLILHFYSMEISMESFIEIEKETLNAKDFGFETLGTMRVPCYMLPDKLRGLPIFLANCFIGNAKEELLLILEKEKIFTKEELEEITSYSDDFVKLHYSS